MASILQNDSDRARFERMIRDYYQAVDEKNLPALYALFSDKIRYERAGYPPIVGMTAFQTFYEVERQIVSGRHTLFDVVVGDQSVAVRGKFEGTLKDGTIVQTLFADFFTIVKGKVEERYTFFEGLHV
ncbi:nuclear transport factor 2 family protein [Sulfoacidibacillus thermotolerans]|uniref:SnoaL-like domain-containing protein n=1 Tax=Sulfoacidibacillus thermotolerans TaxID=1765684 RepID=A0A2U3DBN4_SULT2|nr:nuclear transport factor 2 family protein [Sulfoacidibacillus thermotolerans]PWI58675.1 hypothetical protein BM613_00820 [Sulfoacidibacillus thermotolerans]